MKNSPLVKVEEGAADYDNKNKNLNTSSHIVRNGNKILLPLRAHLLERCLILQFVKEGPNYIIQIFYLTTQEGRLMSILSSVKFQTSYLKVELF